MPINNNKHKYKLPISLRDGESPYTLFRDNLHSIKLSMQTDTSEEFKQYVARFCTATWNDSPHCDVNIDGIIAGLFAGDYLPTALELIRLNFIVEGISIQEATHILRYRGMSFSAECSDKSWKHKSALVPGKILGSEYYGEYEKIVRDSKELYSKMLDEKKISVLDARSILPRCMDTFYFMSCSMKDAIHFIRQRQDEMIQPETDNILALLMLKEISKVYPDVLLAVKITAKSDYFIKAYNSSLGSNLYMPNKDTDVFEYNADNFIYKFTRENHESPEYQSLKNQIISEL